MVSWMKSVQKKLDIPKKKIGKYLCIKIKKTQ